MKKIYSTPTCETIGADAVQLFADSQAIIGTGGGVNIDYGGEDNGNHEGESNIIAWDHFDDNF